MKEYQDRTNQHHDQSEKLNEKIINYIIVFS